MSEQPELGTGEEELIATLLSVVEDACATMKHNELNSWGFSAYARAMRLLQRAGLIEFQSVTDDRIVANMTSKGAAFLERLYEKEKQEAGGGLVRGPTNHSKPNS